MYVDEVNQRLCLEESEQWLENVDRTNLVLGSGKLVLQKRGLNLMNVRWLDSIVPSSCFFSVLFYFYKDKLLLSLSPTLSNLFTLVCC